ncbi:MAG: hypothetical protein KAJ10_08550 [Thermodesulfovibrionia bacterium]|nr:hypothetical protein [Thermodesulfovibrionia bacterium]
MKTSAQILIILSLVLGACSSSYKAGVSGYDDLYYTPKDARMQNEATQAETQTESSDQQEALSDYERYRLALEDDYNSNEQEAEVAEFAQQDTLYYDETGEGNYAYYDDGTTPVVNNYYGEVHQYPSYEARINRFQTPYTGYSYYDPYAYGSYYDPYYDPYYEPYDGPNEISTNTSVISIKIGGSFLF